MDRFLKKFFSETKWIIMTKGAQVALLLILCLALLVRVAGIKFGLPYPHHSDEPNVIHTALTMLKMGEFHPYGFFHCSGYIYMQLPVAALHYLYLANRGMLTSVEEIKTFWKTDWFWTISHPSFYVWARALTAILGTATVFLVYKIGSKTYNKKVGLIAALFLAFAFGHVKYSRFIATDVPVTFFDTFAVLMAVNLVLTGKRKWYVLAGLLAGYAVATKYNNVFIVIALLTAHLLNQHKERFFDKNLLIGASCVIAGFLIGCPYGLLDLPLFVRNVVLLWQCFEKAEPGASPGMVKGLTFYYQYIISTGFPGFLPLFAGVGIFLWLFKKTKLGLLLIVFPLIYFLFMSSRTYLMERFAIPVIPFLAVFAAVGLYFILQFIFSKLPKFRKAQNLAIIGVALLVVFAPARRSIENAWQIYHSKETRVEATEWMKRNISAGSKVAIIKEFHWHMPDLKDAKFEVISVGVLEKPSYWYSENGIDYIVTSDRFAAPLALRQELLNQCVGRFKNASLVKGFGHKPLALGHLSWNPRVAILRAETGAQATAQEGKELIRIETEERAPGGRTYQWKEYKFILEEWSDVYIKLGGKAGSALQGTFFGDDDLTIQLDNIIIPWNSYYSLNGGMERGRTAEVDLHLVNIAPGEHTLTLLADERPTLLSLKVTAFPTALPEKIEVYPNETAPGGNTYLFKTYQFLLKEKSDVEIELSGSAHSSLQNGTGDDDDLGIQLDDTFFGWNNNNSLNGDHDQGKVRTINIKVENVPTGPHTVILFADETPILHSLKVMRHK